MERQLTERMQWWQVEDADGTTYYPLDYFTAQDVVREHESLTALQLITGYGVRLSMPGYLDCTPWEVHVSLHTAEAAYDALAEDDGDEE